MNENQLTLKTDQWVSNLANLTCTEDIIQTLQEIFNEFSPISEESTNPLIASMIKLIKSCETNFERFELELLYKVYYKILTKSNMEDLLIYSNFKETDPKDKPYILNGILFTNFHSSLNDLELYEKCLQVFQHQIKGNSKNLIIIIKALNLYCKKYQVHFAEIRLEDFYICLQNGIRDETLTLFEYCLVPTEKVDNYLRDIIQNWSWTNKNKYFFLSSIMKGYTMTEMRRIINFKLFFEGVRTSLNLKNLFSAGQSLIKVLSKKNDNDEFYEFIIEILSYGSYVELRNLYSQWMKNIESQKLYDQYMKEIDIERIASYLLEDKLRFVIICNIFQSEIIENETILSNIFAVLVRTEFIDDSDTKIHLFAYIFVVNSLNNLCLKDALEYLLKFYNKFLIVPCPDFRQTALSKFPQILHFLSKKFTKSSNEQSTIQDFIKNLFELTNDGINNWCDYQKLIFSSKIIEFILKFMSSNTNLSNKNRKVKCNESLVKYLKEIMDYEYLRNKMFSMFELIEFDDIRELFITILEQLQYNGVDAAFEEAKNKNSSSNVDVCYLTAYYIRICLTADNFRQHGNENQINNSKEIISLNVNRTSFQYEVFEYFINKLNENLGSFELDPYWACKTNGHLFGNLSCLVELYKIVSAQDIEEYIDIIHKLDNIIELILKFLNFASTTSETSTSASFELMDESLQLILEKSDLKSENFYEDRKFLLLSFWTTLKACCDLATIIGTKLLNYPEEEKVLIKFEKCLLINFKVLQRCRHKGAIEAAGISLGELVKTTSTQHSAGSKFYQKLFTGFSLLFGSVNNISTTRRGAGLSIMFHHLLKNDFQKGKPLFHYAMKILLSYTQKTETPISDILKNSQNCISNDQNDNFDAVVLHYLCVIVKDTELKDKVSEYYDEIMIAAIKRIQHRDWKVRNAALQLFGAIVPKIVGQKQASSDYVQNWEPTNASFIEIQITLPKTCLYILEYCQRINEMANSTGTILLFLQFFSNIEYIKISENVSQQVLSFREIYWKFLSHPCEKVRKLSAICVVRSHDFNSDLPFILFKCVEIYFKISNPNFEQGLLYTVLEGVYKLKSEKLNEIDDFLKLLREHFIYFYCPKEINDYQKINLLNFLKEIKFDLQSKFVNEILGNFEINNFIDKNFWEGEIFLYNRLN